MRKYRMTGVFITINMADSTYTWTPVVSVVTDAETEKTGGQEEMNLEPAAYSYEYYNEMADEWAQAIRSSPETIPNPDTNRVRNITPLIPLPEVKAAFNSIRQLDENERTAESTANADTDSDPGVVQQVLLEADRKVFRAAPD